MRSTSARVLAAAAAAAVPMVLLPATAWAAPATAEWTTYQAELDPVTANNVTGSGKAMIQVSGDTARITVTASGLAGGNLPHIMQVRTGGAGLCPSAAEAKEHNGHLSVDVADGTKDYGQVGSSLTTSGDSGPESALAVTRYPTGPVIDYGHTVAVSAGVVNSLRAGRAVLVVHGVDYNGNGAYDDILGASELDGLLPAEATDPALCGTMQVSQMTAIPRGGADTGDGGTQADGARTRHGMAAGAAAALLGVGAGALAVRRRPVTER